MRLGDAVLLRSHIEDPRWKAGTSGRVGEIRNLGSDQMIEVLHADGRRIGWFHGIELSSPANEPDAALLSKARAYADAHLVDLATAVLRVSVDPENASITSAWSAQTARPYRKAKEDQELTRLARARAAEKRIDFRAALGEIMAERVDLAKRW
jgi:hypothetical protein